VQIIHLVKSFLSRIFKKGDRNNTDLIQQNGELIFSYLEELGVKVDVFIGSVRAACEKEGVKIASFDPSCVFDAEVCYRGDNNFIVDRPMAVAILLEAYVDGELYTLVIQTSDPSFSLATAIKNKIDGTCFSLKDAKALAIISLLNELCKNRGYKMYLLYNHK